MSLSTSETEFEEPTLTLAILTRKYLLDVHAVEFLLLNYNKRQHDYRVV